jgi:hypothetical protein
VLLGGEKGGYGVEKEATGGYDGLGRLESSLDELQGLDIWEGVEAITPTGTWGGGGGGEVIGNVVNSILRKEKITT